MKLNLLYKSTQMAGDFRKLIGREDPSFPT